MKGVFDFIKLPLSLPISPIWDFVICAIIGEIACQIAFHFAGEIGDSSGERLLFHWIIRIPLYFIMWLLACFIIIVVRFFINHLWALVPTGVLIVGGIIFLFLIRRKRKNMQNATEDCFETCNTYQYSAHDEDGEL